MRADLPGGGLAWVAVGAFALYILALVGLAALLLWRVLEATLLRLHGA